MDPSLSLHEKGAAACSPSELNLALSSMSLIVSNLNMAEGLPGMSQGSDFKNVSPPRGVIPQESVGWG